MPDSRNNSAVSVANVSPVVNTRRADQHHDANDQADVDTEKCRIGERRVERCRTQPDGVVRPYQRADQ